MKRASFATALVSLVFPLISCASFEPPPVPVIGTQEDLVTLTGEWVGKQGMISSNGAGVSVLSIELVRIAAGEISGRIAPYADPEVSGATLETHFSGRVAGEEIEGTFVTYSDHGVSPRRGTWRVHRKPAG